jgi:hypothetical protein
VKRKIPVVVVAMLVFFSFSNDAFAQTKKAQSYPSIIALKSAFVKSGGQCWEWSRNAQMFPEFINADCDEKTVLIYYLRKTNTMTEALRMAKSYRSLGFKINLLVGPNWIINSDQVVLVSKKLGGTLITR